jgi:hypothetical protein
MRLVPLLLLLALVTAGCGARSSAPYTAKGTVACLKKKDFTGVTTSPAKVGFIAGFAANGGILALAPDNNRVTIAFGKDASEVEDTENAFRRSAPASLRPHISDVMRSNRNAVMVWTTTPSSEDDQTVQGCLAP